MQEKSSVDYLKIFKESFRITWKKKLLWIFGFFILFGSGMNSFMFDWKQPSTSRPENFLGNIFDNKTLLMMIAVLSFLLFVLLVALRIIGQAALIQFAGKETFDESLSFSALFKKGKKYLKNLFLLDVLFAASLFAFLLVLSLPVISLLLIKSKLLALLVGLFALLIFIPVSILVYFIKKFAYMYIVLSQLNIRSSIENAYKIFKNNLSKNLLFSLFLIMIGILFGLILLVSLFVLSLPLLLLGSILSLIFSKAGLYFSLGLGLILLALVFIISRSAFESFSQISWVLLFKELAGIKIEKKEAVEKIVPEKILEPEQA